MFPLLKELLESNNELVSSPDFAEIKKVSPDFARKLSIAWDGDIKDVQKSPETTDLLFPKMIDAINKFAPKLNITPDIQQTLDRLKELHSSIFSKK